MKLSQLVKEIHGAELTNDAQVYGLCADSRVAGEGDLFFCFRGTNTDAHIYAREAAEREKVDVRLYTVIYKAIEDMELAMKGLLAPEYREVLLGHAEVRNVFKITGAGVIAGCYVTDGKVQRNAQVRLLRDNVVVFEGKLSSLKHYKEDVKEMAAGFECGMSLEGHNDIKEGDVVECFIMEEIPR